MIEENRGRRKRRREKKDKTSEGRREARRRGRTGNDLCTKNLYTSGQSHTLLLPLSSRDSNTASSFLRYIFLVPPPRCLGCFLSLTDFSQQHHSGMSPPRFGQGACPLLLGPRVRKGAACGSWHRRVQQQ